MRIMLRTHMLLLVTWWQKIPCSLAHGVRAFGGNESKASYDEEKLEQAIDLHPNSDDQTKETIEKIEEITLGIATKGYNGHIYDTPEEGKRGLASTYDSEKDPETLPDIEEMPDGDTELQEDYVPVPLEKEKKKEVFKRNEDGMFPVVIEYHDGKRDKILKLLSGNNPGSSSVSIRSEIASLHTIVTSVTKNKLRRLKRSDDVKIVSPDASFFLIKSEKVNSVFVNETLASQRRSLADYVTYGHTMVKADKILIQGNGVKVCVLDQGYDYNHQDLPPNVEWVTAKNIDSSGNICCPHCSKAWQRPCSGHGTHVSGTIAAKSNSLGVLGVSTKVGLVEGATLDYDLDSIHYIHAMRDCAKKGARVVNMSFGTFSYSSYLESQLKNIVDSYNILLIAAAGNHGNENNRNDALYPAGYDSVLSVANVDSRGRRNASSGQNNPNISGPGTNIWSTLPGNRYASKTGTSMAAPHVAGVAALVMSAMPWLSASQIKDHLLKHASYLGRQPHTGSGLVDPGFFPIALKQSGKCLDHKSLTSYGRVHLWDCHGGHQQMWTYDSVNNHLVTSTGLCLDYNLKSGLSVYSCVRNVNQKFYYDSNRRTFKAHGKCLDAHGRYYYNNGGAVQMWGCHYHPNQQWYLGSDIHSKVQLCQHSSCNSGGQYWASFGDWSAIPSQIGNDELTRALIYSHVYFEYFEHSSFRGWHLMFGPWVNLNMGGHNDAVSSFRVRLVPEGKVRLCRHSNCAGGDYYASVGDWRSMPSSVGNDQLTRVYIPRGLKFTYYEHGNFGGWHRTFGSCNHGINLNMGGHNDAVSSFRVRVCY